MNLALPRIIFGSSALGNLYEHVPFERKLAIVEQWLKCQPESTTIDSAGKYGAGLSLECIGRCLRQLGVAPGRVLISNKLGWKRVPLTTPEPTFDIGLWVGIEHDVVECMGYDGIHECHEQGNALLGDYSAELLSVHDPDEYIAGAEGPEQAEARYRTVLDSYRALVELREAGKSRGIGLGSKDWRLIKRVVGDGVPLDWVMFANSFTLHVHPVELQEFMSELHRAGVRMINSAVFNAGFLIGGSYFDYRKVSREQDPGLFGWRDRFYRICERHSVAPALACCQFALSVPGVDALALNTSRPERVAENVALVHDSVPDDLWHDLKAEGILRGDYPYL